MTSINGFVFWWGFTLVLPYVQQPEISTVYPKKSREWNISFELACLYIKINVKRLIYDVHRATVIRVAQST